MISAGWRRLGISPAAFVILGLAAIAMLLSRGAGSGWLVVVAAVLLGGVVVAALSAVLGLLGLRVELNVPTDTVAGETMTIDAKVSSLIPQLRTLTLLALDGSTHAIEPRTINRIRVNTPRRGLLTELPVEVRGGLPLGIVQPSVRVTMPLATPLAVAPVPAVVSLLDSIGEDPTADVRTVRAYTPGDAARLVHWRSTARRGELMVRELESAAMLRGARLQIRVTLPDDAERADAVASHVAGLATAALDTGLQVELLTREAAGPRNGETRNRRAIGRRLAAAVAGEPAPATEGVRVTEVGP